MPNPMLLNLMVSPLREPSRLDWPGIASCLWICMLFNQMVNEFILGIREALLAFWRSTWVAMAHSITMRTVRTYLWEITKCMWTYILEATLKEKYLSGLVAKITTRHLPLLISANLGKMRLSRLPRLSYRGPKTVPNFSFRLYLA